MHDKKVSQKHSGKAVKISISRIENHYSSREAKAKGRIILMARISHQKLTHKYPETKKRILDLLIKFKSTRSRGYRQGTKSLILLQILIR